jgi:hypothetical protein
MRLYLIIHVKRCQDKNMTCHRNPSPSYYDAHTQTHFLLEPRQQADVLSAQVQPHYCQVGCYFWNYKTSRFILQSYQLLGLYSDVW